jgi:hypothetical protein
MWNTSSSVAYVLMELRNIHCVREACDSWKISRRRQVRSCKQCVCVMQYTEFVKQQLSVSFAIFTARKELPHTIQY